MRILRSRWSRQIALSETETLRAQERDRDFQARDRSRDETWSRDLHHWLQDQVGKLVGFFFATSFVD